MQYITQGINGDQIICQIPYCFSVLLCFGIDQSRRELRETSGKHPKIRRDSRNQDKRTGQL